MKIHPEDILIDHTPAVRRLAERLRTLIREVVPEALEKAYPTWHGIGYRHPQVGYFCAIFPQAEIVRLGFEFGVLLPDPGGILTGDGKQVRYVELDPQADIPAQAIGELLRAAISLPDKRDVRLWLVSNAAQGQSPDPPNDPSFG